MANSYQEGSAVPLANLTEEEAEWLKAQLDADNIVAKKSVLSEFVYEQEGMDFESDGEIDSVNLGFNYELGAELLVCSWDCEWFDPDGVVILLQAFFGKFRPEASAVIEYSWRCDAPRPGEFGGCAVFVSKDRCLYWRGAEFACQYEAAFRGRPSGMRFGLYDKKSQRFVNDGKTYATPQAAEGACEKLGVSYTVVGITP